VGFVHLPVLLNGDSSEFWTLGTFKHTRRDLNDLTYLLFVYYAIKKQLIRRFLQILLS